MIFREMSLKGAYTIDLEPRGDSRGFFARAFCQREFGELGLETKFVQMNDSFNAKAGVLRGMHFQRAPHEESKLVRCVAGRVFDVVVDLRSESPTQRKWVAVELSAEARNAVFVPAGCAHGFLTLEDASELEYLISTPYEAASAGGVRWDDPALAIEWPFEPVVISERDRSFASLIVD